MQNGRSPTHLRPPGAANCNIACGKTDMRKSIDGLATIVQSQYHLDQFTKSIFLFCGGKSDLLNK